MNGTPFLTAFAPHSALYQGWVMHRRLRPRAHHFRYRVFALLLDLDELPALDVKLTLFAWNRWGLFSFQDRDHGDAPAQNNRRPLRAWLDDVLADAGIVADGPARVLCYPRILGYVFNPLSTWFCHASDGALKAIVYEVHNTYDERHAYVLPVPDDGREAGDPSKIVGPQTVRHACAKAFYVSPFLSQDCAYQFRIHPPTDNVAVAIREEEAGTVVLHAAFTGRRRRLGDGALARMLLLYPLMTLKVVFAIHFEALRLMAKGIRRHPHAQAPHSHAPRPAYPEPAVVRRLDF